MLVPTVPNYRHLRKYIKKIDASRMYSNFGPLNRSLISRASKYLSIQEELIQTCSNATLAIEGAIRTSEVKEKYWELPSWTFAATAAALLNSNSQGRFVDVDALSWRANFSSDAHNVLDVLPFGDNLDFSRIPSSARCVVIDAAASIHALENCRLEFNKPTALVISLHATKALPAGEGALFVTNDLHWSQRFKQWTNFGFDENRNSIFIGTNAKASEYSAAVALASFDSLKSVRHRMLELGATVRQVSQEMGLEVQPALRKGLSTPYWIIKTKNEESRNAIQSRLQKNSIMSRKWWGSGCHNHAAFRNVARNNLEITNQLSRTTLGIPFHLNLGQREIGRIVQCIRG